MPTGYAKRREAFEATVVREVKEETGLDVTVGPLVQLTSGYQLRLEVAYAAQVAGGELKLDGRLAPLSSWLAARHGSGAFAALFKAENYSSTSDSRYRAVSR